jgi:hypothetical protein
MERKRTFKPTVVKSSNIPSLFRAWNDWEDGDYVVGVYHSMYETEFKKAPQKNWRIKVTDCNFKVNDKSGKLIDPVGKILTLNSAGQLNKFMAGVDIGMMVDITYGGKVADKNDPKTEYHTFTEMAAGEAPEDMGAEEGL